MPALRAVIRASTIEPYGMLAKRSAQSFRKDTGAPLKSARSQTLNTLNTRPPMMRQKIRTTTPTASAMGLVIGGKRMWD
jgi:hypothetical protein